MTPELKQLLTDRLAKLQQEESAAWAAMKKAESELEQNPIALDVKRLNAIWFDLVREKDSVVYMLKCE